MVATAGEDDIAVAEEARDFGRLGGRLHDHEAAEAVYGHWELFRLDDCGFTVAPASPRNGSAGVPRDHCELRRPSGWRQQES